MFAEQNYHFSTIGILNNLKLQDNLTYKYKQLGYALFYGRLQHYFTAGCSIILRQVLGCTTTMRQRLVKYIKLEGTLRTSVTIAPGPPWK